MSLIAVALIVASLVRTGNALLRVNFGVLLPEQTLSPVAQDPCARLGWARAEQSLVTEEITRRFGVDWTVVRGDGGDDDDDDDDEEDGRPAVPTPSSRSSPDVAVGGNDAVRIKMTYNDTGCSDTYGPFAAMEIYYDRTGRKATRRPSTSAANAASGAAAAGVGRPTTDAAVWAFYGPCCKYALSPVGRYAKLWDVPVITSGGLTRAFSNRTSFPLIVRIVPPYNKLASSLVQLLLRYSWRHTALLYHENLGEDKAIGSSECFHLIDAVSKAIDPSENLSSWKMTNQRRNRSSSSSSSQTDADADEDASAEDSDDSSETSAEYDDESQWPFEIPHRDHLNEVHFDRFDLDAILDHINNRTRSKSVAGSLLPCGSMLALMYKIKEAVQCAITVRPTVCSEPWLYRLRNS